MTTIAEKWALYEAQVVPKDAGKVQRDSTKLAFYGGAMSVMKLLFDLTDADTSEDASAAFFSGLYQEITAHMVDVAKGAR